MPTECPVCGDPVHRKKGEAATFCTNRSCPAQLKAWVKHFVSKDVYDIDGFGGKLAETLVDGAYIQHPLDLFELTIEELESLDRMGEKSAAKLFANIQSKRKIDFDRFLMGLNIPLLGHTVSRLLGENFKSLELLTTASPEQIGEIEGIGDGIAANVIQGLYSITHTPGDDNLDRWLSLIDIQYPASKPSADVAGTLQGDTFVVTGKLTEPRSKIHELIEANGGKTASSITKKVNWLVCGESAGSKYDKALKLGVTCISEDDLRAWCKAA